MRFLRSGMIYVAANFASAAVPFLLLPLLTRVLQPADYGFVVAFTLMMTLCQAVAGLNAHAALGVLWFQRPHEEIPAFTGTALLLALVSTLAMAGGVGAVLYMVPGLSDNISPLWGMLAAVAAGANVIMQCRLVLWQSQSRALPCALLQFGASILNVLLSLIAVLWLVWGGAGRNAGIAASMIVMAALSCILFWQAGEIRWSPSREQMRTLVKFGLPLIAHTLAGVLLGTADRWAVSITLDSVALGIYGAGAQLGMVMAMLGDAFVKAYSPWIYGKLSKSTPDDRLCAVGAIYVAVPGFLVLAVGVGIALSFVGVWLLGPQYRHAIQILPWFMLGGAFFGIYLSTAVLFFHAGKTGRLASITLSAGILGAAATWFCVQSFGLMGAAAGYAISQCLLAAFTMLMAMRSFELPWATPRTAIRGWYGTLRSP